MRASSSSTSAAVGWGGSCITRRTAAADPARRSGTSSTSELNCSMASCWMLFRRAAEHPSTRFHARYGEFEATVEIGALEVLEGELPRRALNLVREWAMMHREELLEDWRFCRENAVPTKIEPLA